MIYWRKKFKKKKNHTKKQQQNNNHKTKQKTHKTTKENPPLPFLGKVTPLSLSSLLHVEKIN